MILGMTSTIFRLIVLLFPYIAVAQTNQSVSVGASITATDDASSWLSSSGDFAFGFHQLEYKDHFLLSIWYNKIPDKTIVWYAAFANGTDPAVPKGSKVQLTADRGLVLADPQGEVIWTSNIVLDSVSSVVMDDTGNFVLQNSKSERLWESFNNPTDTLLPTQIMETGGLLFSRRLETNFSLGRFQFRFLDDGNLVLNQINLPTKFTYDAYYTSETNDASNPSNSGYRLIFNESGYMYILRRNEQRFNLTEVEVPATGFYQRATLNFDGVFTQYIYPKTSTGNGSWSSVWSKPDDICVNIDGGLGSGACGYNSICRLDTDNKRPICFCPQGFSLLDPEDKYGTCIPDFELSCKDDGLNSTDLYDFLELGNVDWPTSDYERFRPYNEDDCKKSCLNDCLCAVAIFRDGCWKKKWPLSNGRADIGMNGKAFIKIPKGYISMEGPPHQLPDGKRKPDTKFITGSVLFGSSVFINFVLLGAFCLTSSVFYRKKTSNIQEGGGYVETNLRHFTYKELSEATIDFKEELGRGAFGSVFKGTIHIGSTNVVVAIKKLDKVVKDGEKEFQTEVHVIGQTHHKNLVKLLGFCNEGQHRLLVYEFLSNGTLANFLFGNSRPGWKQRIKIAFGIARGLLYLHEECSTRIIHCDIKPQNILLDDYYEARISDFGLAKLLVIDQSKTQTAVRGTKGYIAAEWFRNTPITVKVDVYSFGVLLLEIICCRRSVELENSGEEAILTYWAFDCYRSGTLDALIENDMEAMNDICTVERLLKVAIWCIQEEPSLRPTMRKVSQMLEGVIEVPVPPNPFPFSIISCT